MFTITRIKVRNFAIFPELDIEPSTDEERNLTVIRAENGAGKTTLLNAIRWGLYGEEGLPKPSHKYSVHPVYWNREDEQHTETEVQIHFTTDGTDRTSGRSGRDDHYILTRKVKTTPRIADNPDEPDYHRIEEKPVLVVKGSTGQWTDHELAPKQVIKELVPSELRDFFVMDADEATAFAGGSESIPIDPKIMEQKTTAAVNNLLGLAIFKKTIDRVEKTTQELAREATKAIGDAQLEELHEELEAKRSSMATADARIVSDKEKLESTTHELRNTEFELEEAVKGTGSKDQLDKRLQDNKNALRRLRNEKTNTLLSLAGLLQGRDLISELCRSDIRQTYATLKPLFDKGDIPLKHLEYIRDLLENGTCVCGQDLRSDGEHRQHVMDSLKDSEAIAPRAAHLHHLFTAATSLMPPKAPGDSKWMTEKLELEKRLSNINEQESNQKFEKDEIEKELDKIDDEKVNLLREEKETLRKNETELNQSIAATESESRDLHSQVDSLQKKVRNMQEKETQAQDKKAQEKMGTLAHKVLDGAYRTIQKNQVEDLSNRMNSLFHSMAHNATANDDRESGLPNQQSGVTLIKKVGLKRTSEHSDMFRIFVENYRDRSMPPIEINGASRRVIALSFVLALCEESKTDACLVADSLLNMMSGQVRSDTLATVTKSSRQPILLLTPADLSEDEEMESVKEKAGAMYTLTGYSHPAVVNREPGDLHSRICVCNPREWCGVCEREGWADRPNWQKREG